MRALFGVSKVIIVDDGSRDRTAAGQCSLFSPLMMRAFRALQRIKFHSHNSVVAMEFVKKYGVDTVRSSLCCRDACPRELPAPVRGDTSPESRARPQVRLLRLQYNQGKGGAVQQAPAESFVVCVVLCSGGLGGQPRRADRCTSQGMLHARGRYMLMVDSDGATRIEDLDILQVRGCV